MARSRPATLAVLAFLADYAAGLVVGLVHSVSQRALSTTTTRIPSGYNGMGTPLGHCHRALGRASGTTLRSLGPAGRDAYWATTSMIGSSFPGRDVRRGFSGWRLGRPESASTAVMMSGAEGATGGAGGGTPVGGYPPPEHLHGVFAVYKPQGFSSADAVQKIKVRWKCLRKSSCHAVAVRILLCGSVRYNMNINYHACTRSACSVCSLSLSMTYGNGLGDSKRRRE